MNRTAAVSTTAPSVIPRPALWLAGLALAGLLVGVGTLRINGYSPSVAPGTLLVERSLRFDDTAQGHIRVTDATSGDTVAELAGEQGFVRGVLRGLALARRAQGQGAAAPFSLSLHDDGRLLLQDPSTGRRIDIASFGPDNAAVFARWLPARTPAPVGAPST